MVTLYRQSNELMTETRFLLHQVEQQDPDLAAHLERVGMYCFALGKYLKLPPHKLEQVYVVGLLHDIGLLPLGEMPLGEMPLRDVKRSELISTLTFYMTWSSPALRELSPIFSQQGEQSALFTCILNIANLYDELRDLGLPWDLTIAQLQQNDECVDHALITPFIQALEAEKLTELLLEYQ